MGLHVGPGTAVRHRTRTMNRSRLWTGAWCVAAAWLASACREGHQVRWDKPEAGPPPVAVDSTAVARKATLEPGALATVGAAPVVGWTGAGGQAFEVALRTAEAEPVQPADSAPSRCDRARRPPAGLNQYPCTSCHAGARLTMGARRVPDAHDNIQPSHPDTSGAVCATCHAPENAELLALIGGRRHDGPELPALCASFRPGRGVEPAAGTASASTAGRPANRLACTACHDPHHPSWSRGFPSVPPFSRGSGATSHDR
jgi:hypothetical protein